MRRAALAGGGLLGLRAGALDNPGLTSPTRPTGRTHRPNIVFILADDLGYGEVGCYGQREIRTPNLDRMAAEGVRFTQCYAGSTVCAPSRCCLMTGLHTGHAWVRGNASVPLRPEDTTVARVLLGAGYTTGIIGKWGLGEPETTGVPNRQGFDYWFGYLNQHHAHNYYPDYLWRNEEKVAVPENVMSQDNVAVKRGAYSHDLFTAEALSFLERGRDWPFFLYLAYTIPHANNERTKFDGNGMEVPSDAPYSKKPWPQPQKNQAAMVTRLDRDIGRLFAKLKDLGLDENTIVFFSSDNGPHREGGGDPAVLKSSGSLRGHKRDLYEGGIRVPMIARWPGRISAGTTSDQVWSFWDFLPTAAELAGAPSPPGLDGHSVVPALLGEVAAGHSQQPHDFLYWEFHEKGFLQAVRLGDWKGVRLDQGRPLELYDLRTDVSEARNVASEHPEVVAAIEEYLKSARTASPYWPKKT
ncbi:MAG: arylsulfatase [Candidatus Hydrogenedentes bacterium]|nr:arylsulfatase [Candidatus Hydrogenedentota bacterium]